MSESKTDDAYVAALLRERVGVARQGLDERVKAIDAELKRAGYTGKPDAPAGEHEAPHGRGRRTRHES